MGANPAVENTFAAGTEHTDHKDYGGYKLCELATDCCVDSGVYGAPDEELDRLCEFVAPCA